MLTGIYCFHAQQYTTVGTDLLNYLAAESIVNKVVSFRSYQRKSLNLFSYDKKSIMEFAIIRILGNELHPRDEVGSRVSTLKYILENEKEFCSTHKYWVINRVLDNNLERKYIDILNKHNQKFKVIDFDFISYNNSRSFNERINAAINLNHARNYSIKYGKTKARYIFPLDGDCYFTEIAWNQTIIDIGKFTDSRYFSIPMYRLNRQNNIECTDTSALSKDEPQLVFRNDSNLLFNETSPFSKKSKVELLIRLGHHRRGFSAEYIPKNDICHTVGYVIHLNTGNSIIEKNIINRGIARRKSIYNFFYTIECQQNIRATKNYFQKIKSLISVYALDIPLVRRIV